ncbi:MULTISPECIES: STAS domain-containing protein [Desulfococcus]|jgi:anti-sigma B factor antagonist|uniref:Anti-sigma factor antagonist n=1 Tax=Desulfococcus multivorans DSM 2059 TaxID=1121405 RepID=S7V9D2_DESML|nr:STAS domain-containing protein [Desulfococcus multivorans]AOY60347.1 RsbV: anti-sigma-B factor antagonist [Desulfococcus multivorans]AQV02451.1 anti-anti-sigma factor [Desulfococcus multivorans]EPR41133.1 anti-sigma-factor antagonist [Desulfococcus multivorans DSM 2059]MDX9818985.1 STAS domain-containing protein [Desulfococcus multivorans]SJZ59411.1 anti-sigma B factor antagonist [Desulfococcus multivorans DSM 2059]
MEIIEQQQNDAWIFRIDGRLDSNTAPDLETTVFNAIERGARNMVIDFGSLAYISSAGLRVILKTAKDLKRLDGSLVLCAMQDYVREVFEISGFDTFLPIVPTTGDAVRQVSRKPE